LLKKAAKAIVRKRGDIMNIKRINWKYVFVYLALWALAIWMVCKVIQ